MYTIFTGVSDFPPGFVVRQFAVTSHGSTPGAVLGHRSTLAQARALLPPGLVNLDRDDDDDPTVVETWV